MSLRALLVVAPLLALLTGCAASRTPLEGAFEGGVEAPRDAAPVSVLFLFRHESQQHGLDTIPKHAPGVMDFDDLFGDALEELGNIGRYETFTEKADDVNAPERREELATARAGVDYVLEVEVLEESSFRQQALNGLVSVLTLTIIPMPYDWDYTVTARLATSEGTPVASYRRRATLTNWVEFFLMFAYPFHPIEGKREAIYSEALHDIFRQIEAEGVLVARPTPEDGEDERDDGDGDGEAPPGP